MSIVLDALNKAEKERQKNNIFSGASESKFIELKKKYKTIILIFIVCNIAAAAAVLLFLLRGKEQNIDKSQAVVSEIALVKNDELISEKEEGILEEEAAEEVISDTVEVRKNYLKLPTGREIFISGIMNEGADNQSIIIEDEILQAGDEYYQVIFLEISKRFVKVKYKDELYEIPT